MTRTLDIATREPLEALVDRIYRNRVPREILARRSAVWRVLCQSWFARCIPEGASVLMAILRRPVLPRRAEGHMTSMAAPALSECRP
jgi:hypothetical protein